MRDPASRPHPAISLAVLAFVLAARLAQAQATYQVADISTDPQSSNPVELVALGDVLLFTAFSPTDGLEIFRTDGTPDGTSQVTNIDTYVSGQAVTPGLLTRSGSLVYFLVERLVDGAREAEVWRTDGTPAGTLALATGFATSTYPGSFTDVAGALYFVAQQGSGPANIWKSDGTPATTVQVSNAGSSGFAPANLTALGGLLLFTATDAAGTELWRSDGTLAGTTRVADIRPGSASSSPQGLVALGSVAYFVASDGTSGTELWRSDGTAAGTWRVADINPGGGSSFPRDLTNVDGTLFLFAHPSGSFSDRQLWRSDGTAAGTTAVATGLAQGFGLMAVGPRMFFQAGSQPTLWTSDGTNRGTIALGAGLAPLWLTAFGGRLLFSGVDAGGDRELWASDGTPEGTARVADVNPGSAGSDPSRLTVLGDSVFFRAFNEASGAEIWVMDGTGGGTALAADVAPGTTGSSPRQLRALGDRVVFVAGNRQVGNEPFVSDGTAAGTMVLADTEAGSASSNPYLQLVFDGGLYFVSNGLLHGGVWRTDGTPAGTVELASGTGLDLFPPPLALGGALYFTSAFSSVWRTDGTPGGTTRLATPTPQQFCVQSPFPFCFTIPPAPVLLDVGGAPWFTATDQTAQGSFGNGSLWVSDGTPGGTTRVTEIVHPADTEPIPGPTFAAPPIPAAVLGSHVVFAAAGTTDFDGAGVELLISDGTPDGTVRLADIAPGAADSDPRLLTPWNGRIVFDADDGTTGREPWVTDGTPAGTMPIADINPGPDGSDPEFLGAVGGVLVLSAADATGGREPWRTDGTPGGTSRLRDIAAGSDGSDPVFWRVEDGILYFLATDAAHGRELWRTDGTSAGTLLLADIEPGPAGSDPQPLGSAGGLVYFSAADSIHGRELWRTDGTPAGTVLLEANPGVAGSDPASVVASGTCIVFAATDSASGRELWTSDGTPAGTMRVADIVPGTGSSDPEELTVAGGHVFFSAAQPATGRELWAHDPAPCVGAGNDADGDGVSNALDPCTNVADNDIGDARLMLSKLDRPGREHLLLRGTLSVPAPAAVDPLVRGVRLVVGEVGGPTVIDVVVPGGAYDRATRSGWRLLRDGWMYRAPTGIGRVTVTSVDGSPGTYRVAVRASRATYPAPGLGASLAVTIAFDPPVATTGQCAEHAFAPGTCLSGARTTIVSCR